MDFMIWIFALVHWILIRWIMAHQSQRSKATTNNDSISRKPNLVDLPTEIVQMIVEYLSPMDIASLTLCNHTMLYILGRRHWTFPDSTVRTLFLIRLERDLPAHFFCEFCSALHSRDSIGPPGPAFQPRKRLRRHIENNRPPSLWRSVDVHPVHSLYEFNFTHLQLAMKRYYLGPDHGVPTESLSYTEVRVFGEKQVTTLLSVEAQICSASNLCMRVQNWALVEATSSDHFVSKIGFIWICTHLSVRDTNISRLIRSKLEAYYNSTDSAPHSTPEVFKCRTCDIDYQLEIGKCGGEGPALVITKWLDLGTGLIPNCDRWRNHLGANPLPETGALHVESAGDVRSRFDDRAGLSLDSLTRQNESYLADGRFMEEMDWWDQKTWILQGGKRLPSDYPRPPGTLLLCACTAKESTDAMRDLTAQVAVFSQTLQALTLELAREP